MFEIQSRITTVFLVYVYLPYFIYVFGHCLFLVTQEQCKNVFCLCTINFLTPVNILFGVRINIILKTLTQTHMQQVER